MRILVVGAGAIGGYVGAKMALAAHEVTLVGRQALVDAVAARGLRLIEPEGEHEIRDCRAVALVAAAFDASRRYDLVLFTVKTYDTHQAIDDLRPYAQNVDRFLSLQNGVSSEDLLGEAFGSEKIVAGSILNPVSIREPGVVVLERRRGGIGIASLRISESANQPTNPLADPLSQAGFRTRAYADYRAMKWSKLLLNLIGNATAAILDLNTMEIFRDERLFAIEIAALREAMRVARAQRIRFVNLPGYPVSLFAAAVRILPLSLLQPVLIPLVAKGRGSKMPSLHIDLWCGKRRSEIDELNGAVVRIGAQMKVATPANALLVTTFEDLQSGSSTERAAWRHQADRLWAIYTS
ncbi:MAG TPA: ketopantoate reductase family protein [Anaerolineae bacterium]|nr:ketopantoate reductase family protein [Anaerolineae bacterium]